MLNQSKVNYTKKIIESKNSKISLEKKLQQLHPKKIDLSLDRINKLLIDRNLFMKTSYAATDVIHNNLGSATRVVRNIIHD